jgi:hypothetical protein
MGSSRVVAALANALTRLTQLLERGVAVVQFLPCIVYCEPPRQDSWRWEVPALGITLCPLRKFYANRGALHINLCVKCVVVRARPFLNTVAADRTFLRF